MLSAFVYSICGTIHALNHYDSALFSELSDTLQHYDSQIGMAGDFNSILCSNKNRLGDHYCKCDAIKRNYASFDFN